MLLTDRNPILCIVSNTTCLIIFDGGESPGWLAFLFITSGSIVLNSWSHLYLIFDNCIFLYSLKTQYETENVPLNFPPNPALKKIQKILVISLREQWWNRNITSSLPPIPELFLFTFISRIFVNYIQWVWS